MASKMSGGRKACNLGGRYVIIYEPSNHLSAETENSQQFLSLVTLTVSLQISYFLIILVDLIQYE